MFDEISKYSRQNLKSILPGEQKTPFVLEHLHHRLQTDHPFELLQCVQDSRPKMGPLDLQAGFGHLWSERFVMVKN